MVLIDGNTVYCISAAANSSYLEAFTFQVYGLGDAQRFVIFYQ